MKKILLLLLIFTISLFAIYNKSDDYYSSIVIDVFNNESKAIEASKSVKNILSLEKDLKSLESKFKFKIVKSNKNSHYIVELTPFKEDKVLAFTYIIIRDYYPKAFILRYGHIINNPNQLTKKELEQKIVNDIKKATEEEIEKARKEMITIAPNSGGIWNILYGLITITILTLIWMLYQSQNMKKLQKKMYAKQFLLEEEQKKLLLSVGDKINTTTKDIMSERDKILDEPLEKINKSSIDDKIKTIRKADIKLLDATNDLVEFLKIKSGKIELKEEPFDINTLLNGVSSFLTSKYKNRTHIDFIININKNVDKFIVGDKARLNQIVVNLLENAFKYTTRGEIILEISKVQNSKFEFIISDTGVGIKKEKVEKLFKALDGENDDIDRGGSSSSLGLYITKELISKMGGEISVVSNYGKGSTFKFTIPKISDEKIDKEFLEQIGVDKNYNKLHNIVVNNKIMIIESNSTAAMAISNMFEMFMNNVMIQSISTIQNNRGVIAEQDILLVDDRILTLDIILILEEIKRIGDVKIVALNTLLIQEESEDEELKGKKAIVIDRYLPKPLTPARVEDLLKSIYVNELEKVSKEGRKPRKKLKIYKEEMPKSVNITRASFKDFSEAKILIVEDNKINQRILAGVLEGSGIRFTIAINGMEALQELSKYYNKFDLILMDIEMPIMNGYDATKKIRDNREFDELPIVALTGLTEQEDIKKMISSGMNGYILKPLHIGALYTAFKRFLDISHIQDIADNFEKKKEIAFNSVPHILDIDEGLKRANNSTDTYAEVLKEFIDLYGDSPSTFEKLIMEKRYLQAKNLCLDMKLITSAIGAKDMNALLVEIHQLFMYNLNDKLVDYIDKYEMEMEKLLMNIEIFERGLD
ncbi:COG2202: FOG: PAS/PAC domain [hydrothermal vent metagenome]|uniref:COG2202: FOG: PAS/PAC domain n=1 Tax=hydrothermal vent metagenome TaxID=652676 RepID=A0A1W1EIN4_9ZZZZ